MQTSDYEKWAYFYCILFKYLYYTESYFIGGEGKCLLKKIPSNYKMTMYSNTNLLHEIRHKDHICKCNDHASCGCLHHGDNPLKPSQVIVPGQSL